MLEIKKLFFFVKRINVLFFCLNFFWGVGTYDEIVYHLWWSMLRTRDGGGFITAIHPTVKVGSHSVVQLQYPFHTTQIFDG
jgi:hypothetical protein